MAAGSFIVRRCSAGALVVFAVSVVVFLFLHLIPGDPVDHLAGGDATVDDREKIARCLHLDKPLATQFTIFLRNIANGTLGHQCPNPAAKPTVMHRILTVMPYTLELALGGMLVALLFSIPLGVLAAVHRGKWMDTIAATISLLGISMPVMWMGPLCIMLFFIHLGWLPGPAEPNAPFALVLPSVVVGTHLMAMLSRMTRASLVDVLREDYIRTATAKGLPRMVVLFKHALRNALLPIITIVGIQFGAMLSGAIITEKVFSRPGLGQLLLDGILERNYPIVQGTVFVIAIIYVVVNIVVDIVYSVTDPRIRYR